MIRIGICDDDQFAGKQIDALVEHCLANKGIIYEKELYTSSEALWYEIDDGRNYDLLLLDIEMPQLDGMRLTERIKKCMPDTLVVFISSHERYVFHTYRVQPFWFVPKRQLDKMLPDVISRAVKEIQQKEDKFIFAENQEGSYKIPTKKILFIWHEKKYAYIELDNQQTIKVRKTLKQVYEMLPEGDFVWVNRGAICNLQHIARISNYDAILTNEEKIEVSIDRLTEVKRLMRRYWTGEENK